MKMESNLGRRHYIDLLRGFFIFVIIVDHLALWPNGFEFFTGKGSLWVSAAEGFFIVSGMMVGMIRGREWLKRGWRSATKKLWFRATQLYLLAISLTLAYTAVARAMGNSEVVKNGALANDSWGSVFLQTLTGQYVYGWSDFLLYYSVFLTLAPLVLWALARGTWFIVMVASLLAYSLGEGHFGMLWQPLFFGGLVFGFYLPHLEIFWEKLGERKRTIILWGVIGFTFTTVALSVLFMLFKIYPEWYRDNLQDVFERFYGFGIGRLILAPFWFLTIYWLFKRYQDQISRVAGWLLFTLGRNALSAYAIHAVFVFFIHMALPDGKNLIINFIVTGIAVLGVWYLVRMLQPSLALVQRKTRVIIGK